MKLEFNLPNEIRRCECGKDMYRYKGIFGIELDSVKNHFARGRLPLGLAGVMQGKLQKRNGFSEIKEVWDDGDYGTSDLLMFDKDEKNFYINLVLDGQNEVGDLLNSVFWIYGNESNSFFLEKYSSMYSGDGVIKVSKNSLVKINEPLSKKNALENKLWRILLRHPDEVPKGFDVPGLHKESIDYVYSEIYRRFGESYAMKINLGGKVFGVGSWNLNGISNGSEISNGLYVIEDYNCVIGEDPNFYKSICRRK